MLLVTLCDGGTTESEFFYDFNLYDFLLLYFYLEKGAKQFLKKLKICRND